MLTIKSLRFALLVTVAALAVLAVATTPAAAQCTPGGNDCGGGMVCANCGSGFVCAVPPFSCCSDGGICGDGMICLACAGETTCAIPPAECCGDGACGGGLECVHTAQGPMCRTAGAPAGGTGGGPAPGAGGPGGTGPGPAVPGPGAPGPGVPGPPLPGGGVPGAGGGRTGGGIPAALEATWPGQVVGVISRRAGEMGGEHETHFGALKLPQGWQQAEIEVVNDAARLADIRSGLDYAVDTGIATTFEVSGTGVTVYVGQVASAIQIEDIRQGQGPVYLRVPADFHCGGLAGRVIVDIATSVRFTQGTGTSQDYDFDAVAAEAKSRGPQVRQNALNLATRLVNELKARGAC